MNDGDIFMGMRYWVRYIWSWGEMRLEDGGMVMNSERFCLELLRRRSAREYLFDQYCGNKLDGLSLIISSLYYIY
jgi:hypothetical protein